MTARRFLHCWAGFGIALFFIAAPAILGSFAQNDDYYLFAYEERAKFGRHPQFVFFNLVGRQIYNVIFYALARLVTSFDDLVWFRLAYLAALALSGALLVASLRSTGLRVVTCCAVALAVLTLPGFQLAFTWITMVPFVGALILSLLAGGWLASVDLRTGWLQRRPIAVGFSAALVMLVALFIYQPWAMLILLPSAARMIAMQEQSVATTLRRIALAAAVYIGGTISYFVLHNFLFLPWYFRLRKDAEAAYAALGSFRFEVTSNILERIQSSGVDAVGLGASLWDVQGQGWGFLLAGAATIAICVGALRGGPRGVAALVGVLGFLLATLIPVVVSAGGQSGFRTAVPFAAILLCCGLIATIRLLPTGGEVPVGVSAAAAGAVLIAPITAASAANNTIEIGHIRSTLAGALSKGELPSRIHLVEPDPRMGLNGRPQRRIEFNVNTSAGWMNQPWMIRSQLAMLRPGMRLPDLAYHRDPGAVASGEIIVTSSPDGAALPPLPSGALVIDMSILRPKPGDPNFYYLAGFTAQGPSSAGHPLSEAFDRSTRRNSFWEVSSGFPVKIELTPSAEREIRAIRFSAGEDAERMPREVEFRSITAPETAAVVLGNARFEPWEAGEVREVALPGGKFQKLEITFKSGYHPSILRIYEIELR